MGSICSSGNSFLGKPSSKTERSDDRVSSTADTGSAARGEEAGFRHDRPPHPDGGLDEGDTARPGRAADEKQPASNPDVETQSPGAEDVPSLKRYPREMKSALLGDLENSFSADPKVVRIYITGDDDFTRERTDLGKVMNRLRFRFSEKGYSLEPIDLQWQPDCKLFPRAQSVSDVCVQEVKQCFRVSTGIALVILSSGKNEKAELPKTVKRADFEEILQISQSEDERELLHTWYIQEDDASTCVLASDTAPVSESAKTDHCRGNGASVSQVTEKLMDIFKKYMDAEQRERYLKSALEKEIAAADLEKTANSGRTILVRAEASANRSQFLTSVSSLLPAANIIDTPAAAGEGDRPHPMQSFSTQMAATMQRLLDAAVNERQGREGVVPPLPRVDRRLYEEIRCHLAHCQTVFEERHLERKTELQRVYSHLKGDTPLLLQGPAGAGKTCLVSELAHSWKQRNPGAAVVIRYFGLTPASSSLDGTLHSVISQLSHLYAVPIPTVRKRWSQNQNVISKFFSAATSDRPLLLIIDGLSATSNSCFDWLPPRLPVNVRVILSLDAESEEEASLVLKQATGFRLSALDSSECCSLFQSGSQEAPRVADQWLALVDQCPRPLFVYVASRVAARTRTRTRPRSTADAVTAVFEMAEERFGARLVGRVSALVSASRVGLSDSDLAHLLATDGTSRRLSMAAWAAVRLEMGPYLRTSVLNGHQLTAWRHSLFRATAERRYLGRHPAHSLLADLFEYRWAAQPGGVYRERALGELPHHCSRVTEGEAFVGRFLLSPRWVADKIRLAGVQAFLADMAMADCSPAPHLPLLREAFQLSQPALDLDVGQLRIQISSRLDRALPRLRDQEVGPLTSLMSSPSVLSGAENILRTVGDRGEEEEDKKPVLTHLCRVKSDGNHVISLAPELGEIRVWDLSERTAVRTLSGMRRPRDIKLFDAFRAVVLCDRELVVCDLERGKYLSKLKGVMNANRPYFQVEDSSHVVALSRNRMYIYVLNADTGDLEATFKVGEDRFLDSLLVSENGGILACGDETQKPSPLLIWDLPQRKLVYDLRLTRHEFITCMSDITPNGQHIVCVCQELQVDTPNFITVYDLQSGHLFKKWRPDYNTTCLAVTHNGQLVLNGLETGDLLVWDLGTGSCRYHIEGVAGPDNRICISEDNHTCVTYNTMGISKTITIWDVHNGVRLATFTPDDAICCCEISADGTSVVVGLPGREDIAVLSLQTQVTKAEKTVYGDITRIGQVFDLSNTL